MASLRRRVCGIVFDLDGTLTVPGSIDFAGIRRRCGIPLGADIVQYISTLTDPEERSRRFALVHEEEIRALERMELREHCNTMLSALDQLGLRRALHTRNNDSAMRFTLSKMDIKSTDAGFSILLSRAFLPTKPHPDGLFHIAREWNCLPQELLMVGDSIDDMLAGKRAGSTTILVHHDLPYFDEAKEHADHVVPNLQEIIPLIAQLQSDEQLAQATM